MKKKVIAIMVLSAMCLLAGCGKKDTVKGTFLVDDVFSITGRGTVVTGTVESGTIDVGDDAVLIKADGTEIETSVELIEQFREELKTIGEGVIGGLTLEGIEREEVEQGDQLVVYE